MAHSRVFRRGGGDLSLFRELRFVVLEGLVKIELDFKVLNRNNMKIGNFLVTMKKLSHTRVQFLL